MTQRELDYTGALNTIHKVPLKQGEIYGLPHFSALNLKNQKKQQERPQTSKLKRKLSIVDREGFEITNMPKEKNDNNMISEYASNYKPSNSVFNNMKRAVSAHHNRA